MKKIVGSFFVILACFIVVTGICASEFSSEIVSEEDDFYYMKMDRKSPGGEPLWLVMEGVSGSNIENWKKYGDDQRRRACILSREQGERFNIGLGYFRDVLEKVSFLYNEMFVAFIQSGQNPRRIKDVYNEFDFDDSIKMFMTVTSSPRALITSHMGIAGAIVKDKPRGISPDLHSFAANVMLLRNPERRFMMNAPAINMEQILFNKLPNHIFLGTREMRSEMERRLRVTQDEYQQMKEIEPKNMKYWFSLDVYQSPYPFCWNNKLGQKEQTEKFLSCMKTNPPILSFDTWGKDFRNEFKVYENGESETPFLTVTRKKDIQTYNWMFQEPFKAAGESHYIVIDLKGLADYLWTKGLIGKEMFDNSEVPSLSNLQNREKIEHLTVEFPLYQGSQQVSQYNKLEQKCKEFVKSLPLEKNLKKLTLMGDLEAQWFLGEGNKGPFFLPTTLEELEIETNSMGLRRTKTFVEKAKELNPNLKKCSYIDNMNKKVNVEVSKS